MLCGNRTPSPSRDQVLRVHSPWTALRQRKKGRQDAAAAAAAPLRESDDDDDGNAENRAPAGEDTHMQDLEDKMQNLGVGKVARPLMPRQNQEPGRFGSPPPPARAFRQRLVPLRTNNGGRRQDHGPFSVPSGPPPAQPFGAASLPFESAFMRTASEAGSLPSLPFGPAGWMSSAGHQPDSNPCQLASFGSDGVLQGGPGAAPHLGPALPRSVAYLEQQQQQQQQDLHQKNKAGNVMWHPQLQQGTFGLASSAEGLLGGAVGAGQRDPLMPTMANLHSLSAEGPLMDKAHAELQQCTEGMGPTVAGHADQAGFLSGAAPFTKPNTGARPACCSRLSSSTGVPLEGEPSTAAGAEGVGQRQVDHLASQVPAALPHAWSNEPLAVSSTAADPSDADASVLSAAFDDAGRVMREAALKGQGVSTAAAAGLHMYPQDNQTVPPFIPASTQSPKEVHAATAMTAAVHRRTSSNDSGGTFKISSSFRFPRCDTHEEDGLEDHDDEDEDKEEESGAPSSSGLASDGLQGYGSSCCWPTASAGGVAGVVKGKRSPQQHQAACLHSPGDHGSRDTAAGATSPVDHIIGFDVGAPAAPAAASTPAGQTTASGGAEAMQQSTGCGEKTGGGSVRCYGRAGYCSGGSSADKRTPGPRQRAPTPAGLLLGCSMFEDDKDDSEDVDLEGRSGSLGSGRCARMAIASGGSDRQQHSSDVSAVRDQGGPSSSMRALKKSGSLAARSRYVQSVAALGEGVGIGVGVAAPGDQGMQGYRSVRACEQQQGRTGAGGDHSVDGVLKAGQGGPGVAGAGVAYGSWGAIGSEQGQARSGTSSGAGLLASYHLAAAQDCGGSSGNGSGAALEAGGGGDDDLEHLMCDECDFVTPPQSPTAASRGAKIGQGAGPCKSVLREGAYAAGEAALQLRKARCASTTAAERHTQHQASWPAHTGSTAAGVPAHPHPRSHTGLHEQFELSQQTDPLHHHTHSDSCLCQHQQQVHSSYSSMNLGSAASLPAAAMPAWAGIHHQYPHTQMLCSSTQPMYSNTDQMPNPLLATPSWSVSRPANWDVHGGGAEAGEAAAPEGLLLHHSGSGGSGWGGDSDEEEGVMHMSLDSLVGLEDFNGHMSWAAARGNGGRAMQLWAELRTRNIAPDLRTLNMLMRCLSKTATDPDHAEHIMSEVCALGDLTPNATTHILLAEIRVRFEQLLGM